MKSRTDESIELRGIPRYYIPTLFLIFLAGIIIIIFRVEAVFKSFLLTAIAFLIPPLIAIIFYANTRRMKKSVKREKYRMVRCIPFAHFFVAMLLTLFGLLMLRIGIAGYGKYGFLVFVPSIILLGLACFGWIVTLMTKITITKDGLIFRRYFSLHFINIPYDFEDIRKIKVKWKFVSIKYKRVVLTAPRHLLIANQREFVQVIEKYAPDKIDIR